MGQHSGKMPPPRKQSSFIHADRNTQRIKVAARNGSSERGEFQFSNRGTARFRRSRHTSAPRQPMKGLRTESSDSSYASPSRLLLTQREDQSPTPATAASLRSQRLRRTVVKRAWAIGQVDVLDDLHIVAGNNDTRIAEFSHFAALKTREPKGNGSGVPRHPQGPQHVG